MMEIPKFREFVTEGKDNKFRLLIVTDEPEEAKTFHTADRLQQEAKKLGWGYYLYKLTDGYTTYQDGIRRVHNKDDKKGFVVSSKDTIAVIRGSVVRKDSWMNLISTLEKDNICCINSRYCIETCTDKYRTALKLAEFGLKQPKTTLITNKEKALESFEKLETEFPIILKTLRGSKGVGVLYVESKISLDSIVQLINKQDEDADLLLQEYIKTDFDVRVLVLGGKVIATMKRPVVKGDFRSNVSQGSKPKSLELTELEMEHCLKAAKAVNGLWTAVDFITSKNRDKIPPFLLEVNSSPGTEGMEEATGRNISKDVIDHFADKKNWVKTAEEVGYKEVVHVNPFGELIGKFDTGNSVLSVIHGEDVKINNGMVEFILDGKKVKRPLVRKYTTKIGSIRQYEEERPVVIFDISFAGKTYKEIEFGVDDRSSMGTEVLLTRKLMKKMNVSVNPARIFVVTTPYSIDK